MIFDHFRDLYFQFFHVLLFIPVQSVGDEKTTGNETISEEWVSKSHTRRFQLRSISTVLQPKNITIPSAAGVTPKHTGVTVSDQKRKHSSRGGALLSSDMYLTLELTEAWVKKTQCNDSLTGGHESWTNNF